MGVEPTTTRFQFGCSAFELHECADLAQHKASVFRHRWGILHLKNYHRFRR